MSQYFYKFGFRCQVSKFEGNEVTAKNYLEVKEYIRILNGLEKTLGRKIPKREQRWKISEEQAEFASGDKTFNSGWPVIEE